MIKISTREYDELKEFLSFYSMAYRNAGALPPELRPMAGLEILERAGRKKATDALLQTINDIVEATRRKDWREVAKIDDDLKRRNLLTLSELRRRFSKDYKRIVKRGKLNDETEYYLINGVLCEGYSELGNEERAILSAMIRDFEEKVSKRV